MRRTLHLQLSRRHAYTNALHNGKDLKIPRHLFSNITFSYGERDCFGTVYCDSDFRALHTYVLVYIYYYTCTVRFTCRRLFERTALVFILYCIVNILCVIRFVVNSTTHNDNYYKNNVTFFVESNRISYITYCLRILVVCVYIYIYCARKDCIDACELHFYCTELPARIKRYDSSTTPVKIFAP